MNFEKDWSSLFEDINIPEVFLSDYMPNANGDYVKMYLYILFLCKHSSEITPLDLSKKLNLPINVVEQGLKYWEENMVLTKINKNYVLNDIKKQEMSKM